MVQLKRIGFLSLFIGGFSFTSNAQFVVHNNGAQVTVSQGCIVNILTGDLNNAVGTIDNAGRITVDGDLTNNDEVTGGGTNTGIFTVAGDWTNNATFTADQSLVNLNGGNQSITGSVMSSFYNLNLVGTGIKSMTLNSEVSGVLSLNNLELRTNSNTMHVLNSATTAVTEAGGFVSSVGAGRLAWDMNSSSSYLFPLGSSVGTPRIRPLAITPASGSANTFAARFANVDATTEGFDVAQMASDLCFVNDDFYYQIDHTVGSDAASITQYYNASQDGNWSSGVHWQNVPQWEDMTNEVAGTSGSYSTLTTANWTDFNQPAFALANALPDVSIAAVAPLCESADPVTLSASPANGDFFGTGVSNGVFTPAFAGEGTHTITYTYTDGFGCTNTASIDIEVSNAPVVTITSSNNGALELCAGETMDLTATAGFANYVWNTSAQTQTITVSTGGQYSVTATDGNGCEGTSAVAFVTVQPVPSPIATANGPVEFCEGESVMLSTAANQGTYIWSGTNSTTPTTVVEESGDYFVTVTNQFGCSGVSNTISVEVTPMDEAIIVENGNLLTVDPPGGNYQWFLNGDPIPGATGISYNAIQSGNYHVEYIGPNGCPTETYVYEFTLHVGVDEHSIFESLDVYPNPGKGEFVISGSLPSREDVTIEVTNMLGQSLIPVIRLGDTDKFTRTMDISGFANGVYFIRIQAADSAVTVRYVKS